VVAKLCAALLVALCILPSTAPFSTDGPASVPLNTNAVIGTLANHASAMDPDDNDALMLERSHFLRQPRLFALMVVASCSAAAVSFRLRPAVAPTSFLPNCSSLKTILRL
jgi:hypothetical protein